MSNFLTLVGPTSASWSGLIRVVRRGKGDGKDFCRNHVEVAFYRGAAFRCSSARRLFRAALGQRGGRGSVPGADRHVQVREQFDLAHLAETSSRQCKKPRGVPE